MKIALTGGTGFVGRRLEKRLRIDGHRITKLIRRVSTVPSGGEASPSFDVVVGSFEDPESLRRLCIGQDAIIHCGWATDGDSFTDQPDDIVNYYRTNVIGSVALLDAARDAGVKRFIFVSTGAVHGRTLDGDLDETHPLWPTSVYGAAKAAIETAISALGAAQDPILFAPCTLRPTSIYGVDDPIESSRFFDLVQTVRDGRPVEVSGGGKMIHVDDLATAVGCLLAADPSAVAGETFNCTGGFLSRLQIAETAARLLGSSSTIEGPTPSGGQTMRTDKIERLGMRFEQQQRLEETIIQLARAEGWPLKSGD